MKSILLILSLLVSSLGFASTFDGNIPVINLDSASVQLPSGIKSGDQFILVRTFNTPEDVTIFSSGVPANQRYCSRYETRMVWKQDYSCGQDVYYRQYCDRAPNGHPINCRMVPYYVTRYCYVPETFCAQYDVRQITISDNFEIEFKMKDATANSTVKLKATMQLVGDGTENPELGNNLTLEELVPGATIKLDTDFKSGSGRDFDVKAKSSK